MSHGKGHSRRSGSRRGRRGPLRCDRRLQADHRARATGAGHSGSGGVADERSGGRAAGPLATVIRTRDRAGGGLAVGRDGAALRLQPGGTGAAVRSQRELGVAAVGAGGSAAGSDPAASAGRQDRGAGGHEVSGSGGAAKPGGLPAHGSHFRRASLRDARSRPIVWSLAPGIGCDAQTDSGRSGAVFQNAEAGENPAGDCGRTDPRSGDGYRDCESGPSADRRRGGGRTRSCATRRRTAADRAH